MADFNDSKLCLGIIATLKKSELWKKHHPALVLNNDNIIEYYYDAFITNYGLIVFTIEPNFGLPSNSKYSLRFVKASEINSIHFDDVYGDVTPTDVTVSDDNWLPMLKKLITAASTGSHTSKVPCKHLMLEAGTWFEIESFDGMNITDNLLSVKTTHVDPTSAVNIKTQRVVMAISAITQANIPACDWFKYLAPSEITDASLKQCLTDYFDKCKIKKYLPWYAPYQRSAIFMGSYEQGIIVKYGSKYYISSIANNANTPGTDNSGWVEYVFEE